MRISKLFLILFFTFGISSAFAAASKQTKTSAKIAGYVKNYQANLVKKNVTCKPWKGQRTIASSWFLYGQNTYKGTNCGKLACAKVVQSVLRAAGIRGFRKHMTGVWQVQKATSKWKTISRIEDILPGDVIFWHRNNHPKNKGCPGGGTCHVGIASSKTVSLDNSGWSARPSLRRIRRGFFTFNYAKRAR